MTICDLNVIFGMTGTGIVPECGDKYFETDVRCALAPGHSGAHCSTAVANSPSAFHWVHGHEQAARLVCPSTSGDHRCVHRIGHAGHHDGALSGNRIGWVDLGSVGIASVAICAADTEAVILANMEAASRALLYGNELQIGDGKVLGVSIGGHQCEICRRHSDDWNLNVGNAWVCSTCLPHHAGLRAIMMTRSRLEVVRGNSERCAETNDFGGGGDERRTIRCECAIAHAGYHASGTGIQAVSWEGQRGKGVTPTEAALYGASIGDYPVIPTDPMPIARGFSPQPPVPIICKTCSSPAAFQHSGYCVYCDQRERGLSEGEVQRLTAKQLGHDEARARNEAALAAERPKATAQSREERKPHPWAAWSTATDES